MEYDEERNKVTGSIPEFGAIFMSNAETMEECLSREVFALPYSHAQFVKQVKAGMALFLFEFETRQLFGVYQASSDGGMDIVPNGFIYSGKRFPAQVRVKPLWHCSPLSEEEFRVAIIENYFSAKKFNFGLSKDQVERLLHLFDARKLKNKQPKLIASNERLRLGDDITTHKQRIFTGSTNNGLCEGDEISTQYHGRFAGSAEYDDLKPVMLHPYAGKSSGRYYEEELMLENGSTAEDKYCHCCQGNVTNHHSPAIRRRIAHGVITTDGIDGNEAYNHLDSPQSLDQLKVSPEIRSNAGDRFTRRNISFEEHKKSNDLVQAYERLHYMEGRDRIKRPASDYSFFLDDDVGREREAHDVVRPNIYGENYIKLHSQARDSTSHSPSSTNEKSQDGYDTYYHNSPLLDIEQSLTHLHRASKTSAMEKSSFDDGIKAEDEFVGFQVVNFQCGNSARELPRDYRTDHDGELLSGVGRASENMFGTIRGPTVLDNSYGRPIDDMHMGKNREVLETSQNLHTYVSHPISTELPCVSKANQGLISHSIDRSLSNFDDAVITRAIPYTHELTKSVSAAADSVGAFERKDHHQNGSPLNFYTSSNNRSSNLSEAMVSSKYLGLMRGCGDQYIINRSNHQETMPDASYVLTQRSPNAYGSLNRESHLLPRVPCTTHDMVECGKESSSHVLKSTDHQFAIDGRLLWDSSQYKGDHTIQREMDNSLSRDIIHQSKAYHTGDYYRLRERNLSSDHNHRAPAAKRRSVFSRLSLGPKVKASARAADTHFDHCHDPYVGASADEVMEMLQQINHNKSTAPKKLRSFKATGNLRDERSLVSEKLSRGLKERLNEDEAHDLPDGDNVISEETQILGFKRRSEAKKNLALAPSDSTAVVNKRDAVDEVTETSTAKVPPKCDAGNEATKTSATKVPPKRRKLIRPIFGKE